MTPLVRMAQRLQECDSDSTRSAIRDQIMKEALYQLFIQQAVDETDIYINPKLPWTAGETHLKSLDMSVGDVAYVEARGTWSDFASNVTNHHQSLIGEVAELRDFNHSPRLYFGLMRVLLTTEISHKRSGKQLPISNVVDSVWRQAERWWDVVGLYIVDNSLPNWRVITASDLCTMRLPNKTCQRYNSLTTNFAQRLLDKADL